MSNCAYCSKKIDAVCNPEEELLFCSDECLIRLRLKLKRVFWYAEAV